MSLLHRFKRQRFLKRSLGFLLAVLQLFPFNAFPLSPYSTHELEELEKEFVQLINQSDSVERNPLATQYINHLGRRLAHFAHIPTPYFFIVKSNEINAFAGPGGYIGINTRLILATENESELAAVMAHEIAHVRLHHLYNMIEHQKQMRIPMIASMLASIALGAINPTLGSGALMASMSGFAQDNINFTRANEKEADRIGIDMLIKSDLDPKAMVSFFKKMQENSRYYYTANIPAILRTHPLDDERIAEAENRSYRLAKKQYPDNLNYRLFKEIIRVSVTNDSKQLLDYYRDQCPKKNHPACEYGYALTLLNINQFQQAETHLNALLAQDHDNLFYQIAMAQAETGAKQFAPAIARLSVLQSNYPENYAALMAYGRGLLAAGQAERAASVLLKGSRQFKKDLSLCEELAHAQAAANRKSYAYFTEAQCQLLQGRQRDAIRQLKLAKTLAKNDAYLQARITAMIDEIKFLLEK
ncbi:MULTISPECIES: M48 family metalloprotease [Legionella]|uniref:Zn-dependent protease n=1 Tax=Legionella maceachernii TaxID=466 RepID=A0A0W0VYU7_9GAMM|nr:M48 family metalloprotease [Legionella maceachernii]KTD25215.1 Zn-dependent protease [Legionella maceachernii]SJZ76572.1 Putative Zn-dependent protease, contains TPR repeats [Legionella maceachernii]SUP03102.1 M48 family peptidase [Legionella maceachernii]